MSHSARWRKGGLVPATCRVPVLWLTVGLTCASAITPALQPNDPSAAAENQKRLQSAVDSGMPVGLPRGVFFIQAPITLRSHSRITGSGALTMLNWDGPDPLFKIRIPARGTLVLENFSARGPEKTWLVSAVSTASFRLEGLMVLSAGLITCFSKVQEAPPDKVLRIIKGCQAWGSKTAVTAINLGHVWDAEISGNFVRGYRHGVTIWGGESNQAKPQFNASQWAAGRIRVTGNVITGAKLGGIWTSRAQDVEVTDNVISDCGDVGLDAEGSRDVSFSNNVVLNCGNGALAVFFSSERVRFLNNVVATTNSRWPLFRVYNSSLKPENQKNLMLMGNTFLGLDDRQTLGQVDNESGPTSGLQVRDNTFWNARLNLSIHRAPGSVVLGNVFILQGIDSGNPSLIQMSTEETTLRIMDNTFIPIAPAAVPNPIRFVGPSFPGEGNHVVGNRVREFSPQPETREAAQP